MYKIFYVDYDGVIKFDLIHRDLSFSSVKEAFECMAGWNCLDGNDITSHIIYVILPTITFA